MYNTLWVSDHPFYYIGLLEYAGEKLEKLPFTLRILLENTLRHHSDRDNSEHPNFAETILNWQPQSPQRPAVPFQPSRILLQDLTGVPLLVDLAALRSAKAHLGADPRTIQPKIPVDLVIDHSLQVDFHQHTDSKERNMALEYHRNHERYQLLRWAQDAFDHFRVVPPGKGIVHQINLEFLASVVGESRLGEIPIVFPDTLFGTDSHTTMINGLGVLGWGVGGIEAIAAMLEKPTQLILPDVIGLSFNGQLPEGSTPTDLTLMIVERLRIEGVVGKFIECFGESLDHISVPDRAMIANMAPETGATVIYFPVDDVSLAYLKLTGRSPRHVELVEQTYRKQGLFRESSTPTPNFTKVIEIDLSDAKPSLAGPFRPQDRIDHPETKETFYQALRKSRNEKGFAIPPDQVNDQIKIKINDQPVTLRHGSLLIAAITSCTNTSNPMVMLAAGMLAQKAVHLGLNISPVVKCSLMPGSQVVSAYLENAGLLTALAQLGFNLVGYGCGTCIGNSGPLAAPIEAALKVKPLITASISSGNRNFEGRIHPLTKANYLASPPLVIAYALAGRIDIDLTKEPLGADTKGQPVFFEDIYPSHQEVEKLYHQIQPELYKSIYTNLYKGDQAWNAIYSDQPADLYPWDPKSTYITEPTFFSDIKERKPRIFSGNISSARALALLGDSITTDHISPAGSIPSNSPAGKYLISLGVSEKEFNTYGARRGNDQVMMRATFANIRLKNRLAPEKEGGYTRHFPSGGIMTIFDAAQRYGQEEVPLIVIGGKEYGTGSSRDWAAKGPHLLGVRAIIAESFERIHRANLVGMGILPLSFKPNQNAKSLGLTGEEEFDLLELDHLTMNSICQVRVHRGENTLLIFETVIRIETESELKSFLAGGILREALM